MEPDREIPVVHPTVAPNLKISGPEDVDQQRKELPDMEGPKLLLDLQDGLLLLSKNFLV